MPLIELQYANLNFFASKINDGRWRTKYFIKHCEVKEYYPYKRHLL